MFKTKKLMNMFKQNPLRLIIVAFIFLIIGLEGLFEGITTLYNEHHISIVPQILGIPVFWGLLKHRKGWRTLALFFIWIETVGSLFAMVIIIFGMNVRFFGISSLKMSFPLALVPCVAIFLVALWQYKVLTSKKIKKMFIPEK